MSGYFRKLYRDNPRLLKKRSNKFAFERWLADHPGHTKVPTQVKQAASNVKSNLRHKLKQRKGALAGTSADDAARQAPRVPAKVLQSLEEHIDTCLGLARQLDPNGLAEVIESLRQARNEVIVKQGKV
ncbi:MAG TPA: hypothetical protein VKD72_08780 [Gemmataceae bacterium]|nr:hypothetical protein [Gemmataceae bacterium]